MFDSVGFIYRCNADVACMRVRGVVWTACFVREDETRSRGKGEGDNIWLADTLERRGWKLSHQKGARRACS